MFGRGKNIQQSLTKTRTSFFGKIASLFVARTIDEGTWEELEELLIQADMGVATTVELVEWLRAESERRHARTPDDLNNLLKERLVALLTEKKRTYLEGERRLNVVLVVGVNGSGKTTSIAKLGQRFKGMGKAVLFGAADTFRAAAVDQLEVWAGRLDLPVISGQMGADSGAVAYDSVKAAQARRSDVVLIDTAGRLHTRFNLMEELKKVYRVVGKAEPGAPHHVWLVMDATTGQNALAQARAFKEAVNVTGVILAKLDSSARGGMAFAIQHDLGLPILFAGLGEKPEDLQPFDPDAFLDGILAYNEA